MSTPGAPPLSPGDLAAVGAAFGVHGPVLEAGPHGRGHIHDTYLVTYAGPVRLVHQRLNETVFPDLERLMENVERATRHLERRLAARGATDLARRTLRLRRTRDGGTLHRSRGAAWRTYDFVEHSRTIEQVQGPADAARAATAFGAFQELLCDLPPDRFHSTIPDFHHTPRRLEQLRRAASAAPPARRAAAAGELEFVRRHEYLAHRLLDELHAGRLPERIVHNDTKINNVLFDAASGEALCVVDLDTVMPGLAAYDFGDLVRTACCRAAEDETDLSRVEVDLALFEALVRGYREATRSFLTGEERSWLAFSGQLLAYETGVRFLTDHLEGDRYFRIHRPGHNMDRARNQFQLVRSLLQNEAEMESIVADHR